MPPKKKNKSKKKKPKTQTPSEVVEKPTVPPQPVVETQEEAPVEEQENEEIDFSIIQGHKLCGSCPRLIKIQQAKQKIEENKEEPSTEDFQARPSLYLRGYRASLQHFLPENSSSEAIRTVASFAEKRLAVRIRDGRVLVGKFQCTDKSNSIFLTEAIQCKSSPQISQNEKNENENIFDSFATRSRFLGEIIIPGNAIESILLESIH